jgi:hypothetical protein
MKYFSPEERITALLAAPAAASKRLGPASTSECTLPGARFRRRIAIGAGELKERSAPMPGL